MKNIIVTGACGYIGGIISIELKRKGYNVIAVDRRQINHLQKYFDKFIHNDFVDKETLYAIKNINPHCIIHCAGTSLVEPSMLNPSEYFDNNVSKTIKLLNFIKDELPDVKFIYSSSAAVYGNWSEYPYKEFNATHPVSPYGESKLMTEKVLNWYQQAYQLKFIAFRYFNACGADPFSFHGQEPGASHIFAKAFEAVKDQQPFYMFGNNYKTRDGTCVRDYIHVNDLANAHIMAIDNEVEGIYNLGTLKGTSNLDVINRVMETSGTTTIEYKDRRTGDPSILIADPTRWMLKTGWIPKYGIDEIVSSLKTWYNSKIFQGMKHG